MKNTNAYFSVSHSLIIAEIPLPYDLYVNSSVRKEREKFVRIWPREEILTPNDINSFKKKYHQLYISEDQRLLYLRSLVHESDASETEKASVIKDSAIHYLNNIFNQEREFSTEVLGDALLGCKESIEYMVDIVQDYGIGKIQDLIGNLSFHDFYTYDHSINVSMYCISMYRTWKPSAKREELITAGLGGLLHDLGKIKIPTALLNKAEKLEKEELAIIATHPQIGSQLLDQEISSRLGLNLNVVKRVILEHHENYNGNGYPNRLKGEEIHSLARITAIADFFDAVTTKRSYHDALSTDEALAIMEKSCGKKIDPKLFDILLKNIKKISGTKTTRLSLPDNFDGGQPYKLLPFIENRKKVLLSNFTTADEKQNFGKVKQEKTQNKKGIK